MADLIVTLFSIAQGSFLFGFSIFLVAYYTPKKRTNNRGEVRLHVILMSISYLILTINAVIIQIDNYLGLFGDLMIWFSFLLGDISLFFIFKYITKRDSREKIIK